MPETEPTETKTLLLTTPEKPRFKTEAEYAQLFELYRLWKSLPVIHLKKMSPEQLFKEIGVDDPRITELLALHYQRDFAEKYDLEESTLSEWNKRVQEYDPLQEVKTWAQPLVKNMILALYANAIKKGDPFLIKLFLQTINEWSEKVVVDQKYLGVTQVNITVRKNNEIKEAN